MKNNTTITPDKAMLTAFAGIVRSLELPIAKSTDGKAVAAGIGVKVDSLAKWIEAQASKL